MTANSPVPFFLACIVILISRTFRFGASAFYEAANNPGGLKTLGGLWSQNVSQTPLTFPRRWSSFWWSMIVRKGSAKMIVHIWSDIPRKVSNKNWCGAEILSVVWLTVLVQCVVFSLDNAGAGCCSGRRACSGGGRGRGGRGTEAARVCSSVK